MRPSLEIMERSEKQEENERDLELITLETEGMHDLIVTRDHPVVKGARTLLSTSTHGNCLFIGASGSGKTKSAYAWLQERNWDKLLKGTPAEGVSVEIKTLHLNLQSMVHATELDVEQVLRDGATGFQPAEVSEFVIENGFTDKRKFLAEQRANARALSEGKGKVQLYVAFADEIDRGGTGPEMQSALLRIAEDVEHILNRKIASGNRRRYLRIQVLATSNSGISADGEYVGTSAGRLDRALFRRFCQVFKLDDHHLDLQEILKATSPHASDEDFLGKLTRVVGRIKSAQADGRLRSLGEVAVPHLRWLNPL